MQFIELHTHSTLPKLVKHYKKQWFMHEGAYRSANNIVKTGFVISPNRTYAKQKQLILQSHELPANNCIFSFW